MKHELTHCFCGKIAGRNNKPVWLFEWICIYLAGQLKLKPEISYYENFLDFFEQWGAKVYLESGYIVKFLVEKYWKEKILDLIKRSAWCNKYEEFSALFEEIYWFELSYENFEVL